MRLSTRIFLAYFALVGVGTVLFFNSAAEQLRPAIRQASEEAMVDTANLLAEIAADGFPYSVRPGSPFVRAVERYEERDLEASIWSLSKTTTDLSVYVTDERGRVIFHTDPGEIGADYAEWNDVARTLEGEYGARTTRRDPDDELSSTMYVAAPIVRRGEIIGVLTVSQPNTSVQPFLNFARSQIWQKGTVILFIALVLGAVMSLWLTRSIRRLADYVEQVRDGRRATPPRLSEKELAHLAESTEAMRQEIEGKRYVEQYIHTLAHEMKSPLSAVRGATELLQEADLPADQRQRFLDNIDTESGRMQRLIDRLLSLAAVEKLNRLSDTERVDLAALTAEETRAKYVAMERKQLGVKLVGADEPVMVQGDRFLLQQALSNLLDNAIDFSRSGADLAVTVAADRQRARVTLVNEGHPVPDFALERIYDRFYSLARPDGGRKSTGLGLSFVREVAALHRGSITIENLEADRVQATLSLPRSRSRRPT